MTLTGKQRFSASSFSGFGGHRMVSSGGSMVGSAGMGRSIFGSFGSNGIGKGFGMAGGGGGHGFGFGGMRGGVGAGAGPGAGMGGDVSLGIVGNEKMQMQYLNDRFAAYLEKVRMLEANNYELEQQLRNITFSKVVPRDFSDFDVLIQQLKQQLLIVLAQNHNISLQIDNAKLAADDFRDRWETELSIRQTLEGDVAGLRTLQHDYDMASQATAQDLQSLMNELMAMKNNHQQEILSMANNIGGCNVNMQVAESVDLSQVLADIRAEYEAVMDYNRRNAECWYLQQAEMKPQMKPQTTQVNKNVVSETQELANGQKYFQTLQMELEGLLMENENLEARHAEVEAQYQQSLMSMSCLVADLEGDVSSIHQAIAQQSQEYYNLLDIKSRLEMEIGTYKQLLEEAGIDGARMASLSAAGGSSRRVMGLNSTGRGVEAAMGASRGIGRASFTMKSSKTTSSSGISSGTSTTVTTSSISSDAVGVPDAPKTTLNVASVMSGGGAEVEESVVTSITTFSSSVSSSSDGTTITSSAVADIPEAASVVTVSSEDAASDGDSAVMTSEGGTLVITSIITESSSSSSETATMSSAVTEEISAAGDVTTELISSEEALITSAGAAEATVTAAGEDMMNEGSVTVGTTEFSASSTGSGEAMISSEGAIISDGDMAIELSASTISSGNGVISGVMSSEGAVMSDEGVMVSGEEAVGASMSSEDAIMVSGGEVEGASMSVQSNGSEFSSSSSSFAGAMVSDGGMGGAIIADSTVEDTVSSVKIALVEE